MKSIQKGHAVSNGIGIGRVCIYKQYVPKINQSLINTIAVDQELIRFTQVYEKARKEIRKIKKFLLGKNEHQSMIFDAHLEMLNDQTVNQEIKAKIEKDLFSLPYAIYTVFSKYIDMLSQADNDFLKERAADLIDVKNRLLRICDGVEESNLSILDEPSIIVARDLFPSDIATIDRNNIQAIITEVGGVTSHAAIIAKSYEIPAIFGVGRFFDEVKYNDTLIVDAIGGVIITNPDYMTIEKYKNKQKDYMFKQEIVKRFIGSRPVTSDGKKIDVALNIGSVDAEELEFEPFVDGVGLFRSEFLYMASSQMPTEEEQFLVYKKGIEAFKKKPFVLRTLDIGGDKGLSYLKMEKEENPFLGNRGVRLCFDHMDMFKTQLRAALRASVYGDLWLLFPMVGSMDDIYRLKTILAEVKENLTKEKIEFSSSVKFGIMIEVPSIVMIADHVAKEVDFASIGTNDLCQYINAVDRMNPLVNQYFQNYSPSMFKFIKMVVDSFEKVGKPVSVCGESGGDLIAAPVLIGLGISKLSMNHSSIASIKRLIVT
ncbi:MAG: phosphoenolpyruvate--protein phosphotransferase, partial [Tenericutes bacterium HGW-Tenericutes-3]